MVVAGNDESYHFGKISYLCFDLVSGAWFEGLIGVLLCTFWFR